MARIFSEPRLDESGHILVPVALLLDLEQIVLTR